MNSGKKVLFSGTPCQTDGLLSYIETKRIPAENLYTMDLICHGVPSPKLWQSYLKYLENKFPAYVVHPREGTPVNLYCVGLFKGCSKEKEALQFMSWLLTSEKVQAVAQANNTGYMFIFPRGLEEGPVNEEKLWLNVNYLDAAKRDALLKKWLERVRFSK